MVPLRLKLPYNFWMWTTFVTLPWKLAQNPGCSTSQLQHLTEWNVGEGRSRSLEQQWREGREKILIPYTITSKRLQLECTKEGLACLFPATILYICRAVVSLWTSPTIPLVFICQPLPILMHAPADTSSGPTTQPSVSPMHFSRWLTYVVKTYLHLHRRYSSQTQEKVMYFQCNQTGEERPRQTLSHLQQCRGQWQTNGWS